MQSCYFQHHCALLVTRNGTTLGLQVKRMYMHNSLALPDEAAKNQQVKEVTTI